MSLYLRIEKEYEDLDKVVYRFGESTDKYQKLEIKKITGDMYKIETEFKQPEHYYLRAASKIIKHNKNNPDNQYPDLLIYAT